MIKFKQIYLGNCKLHNQYNILHNSTKIGEISFVKKRNVFIIGYFKILEYYRGQHFGYQVIEYILSHYKVKCIVGETLCESRGFWNKCIRKFGGQRKNITVCENCSSSFVIPKYKISHGEMWELLDIGYRIS